MKRVKINPKKCPNPLFVSWLEDWKEDAKSRGSEMQYCFGRALNTLKKFPLPLNSGRECLILEHFGPKLCAMLDKKLAEYKAGNSNDCDRRNKNDAHCNTASNNSGLQNGTKQTFNIDSSAKVNPPNKRTKTVSGDEQMLKKTKTVKPQDNQRIANPNNRGAYIPAWRSAGYAILLALYEKSKDPEFIGHMSKADLQADAQKHCDASLKKPDPGTRYCAWSSMSTLIEKGLVIKKSSPAKYRLTDAGSAVAMQLSEVGDPESAMQLSSQFTSVSNNCTKSSKTSATSEISTEISPWEVDDDEPDDLFFPQSTSEPLKSKAIAARIFVDDPISGRTPLYNNNKSKNVPKEKQTQDSDSGQKKKTDAVDIVNIENDIQIPCPSSSDNNQTIILRPQNFDIILLVDDRETAGGKTRPKDDATLAELTLAKVKFDVRNLKIGDFTWIARCRDSGEELILPYIVERKRMDDLGGSIKDGRYNEQKFRLKKSSIENIVYLIEDHGKNLFTGLPLTSLYQAATNTLVQDGFIIKYTKSHRESMFYLASMTVMLTDIYQKKTLLGCKKEEFVPVDMTSDLIQLMVFKDFNKSAAKVKVFKAKEMFIRQLVQLNGLSVEKAIAIVDLYSTPKALKNAYAKSGSSGENLLAGIQCGPTKRQLGPSLSKTLYQFYTRKDF